MPNSASAPELPTARAATVALREIAEVSKEFEAHLQRELTVNPTDLVAMEHLIIRGPSSPAELARLLGVSRPAITASVDRLTALGHATRGQHPTDRRGVVVTAAPESVARAMGILAPMIGEVDSVLDRFTEPEQAVIADYLERVVAAYRSHLGEPSR